MIISKKHECGQNKYIKLIFVNKYWNKNIENQLELTRINLFIYIYISNNEIIIISCKINQNKI
jgi:hypothetical protein